MMAKKRKSLKKKVSRSKPKKKKPIARKAAAKRKKKAAKKRTTRKTAVKRPSRKKPTKKKTPKKRSQKKTAPKKTKKAAQKRTKHLSKKKPTKKASAKKTRAAKKVRPVKPAPEPQDLVSASMGFEELISRTIDDRKLDTTTDPGSLFGIAPGHAPTTDEPLERTETDRLRFLTVDPGFAFAYWEVTPGSLLKAAQRLGRDAKLTLRFREAATGLIENPAAWDVEVFDRLGNWYLKLDTPDQHLDVEIGVKSPTGEFIPISTAERLQLTKEMLSRPGPMKWIANGEYIDADPESLKQILGPYFYELLVRGRFETIIGSSVEAIFHSIDALKMGGHS